jgi:hypothetical protein
MTKFKGINKEENQDVLYLLKKIYKRLGWVLFWVVVLVFGVGYSY